MGAPKYLWLDLETTGLESSQCTVLEVAVIITDPQFVEIDRWRRVVHHDVDLLMMQSWPWKEHTESGLLDEVRDAKHHLVTIDSQLHDWMAEYDAESPLHLAGSSIHFDRAFMQWHMPKTFGRLYYRQFDVSVFRVISEDWWPDLELPEKQNEEHRAAADVENSLALARFFKERLKAE